MFFDSHSERNFGDLVEALRSGDVAAFLGAGLSASHQPSWKQLHALLQDFSQVKSRRAFEPEFAPSDFEHFREKMGSEAFFGFFKKQFAGPVGDYPHLYQTIDETQGFRHIVTTNFDEYLATVAQKNNRNPEIIAHPNFHPFSARYIYLHGRAYTAQSTSDLIVCESDYARAYENEWGPLHIIRGLLSGAVAFIGYSLSDGDIQATLRGL